MWEKGAEGVPRGRAWRDQACACTSLFHLLVTAPHSQLPGNFDSPQRSYGKIALIPRSMAGIHFQHYCLFCCLFFFMITAPLPNISSTSLGGGQPLCSVCSLGLECRQTWGLCKESPSVSAPLRAPPWHPVPLCVVGAVQPVTTHRTSPLLCGSHTPAQICHCHCDFDWLLWFVLVFQINMT